MNKPAMVKAFHRECGEYGTHLEYLGAHPEVDGIAKQGGVWRSRSFLVCLWFEGAHKRLTVNRTRIVNGKWEQNISWDELMRLKAEAGYADWWAIEIYPPTEHVVNVANMRHLWLLEEKPAMAWEKKS